MNDESNWYVLHRIIRYVTGLAAVSFFSEIRVVGGENVPKTGPIIVTATHHNMMLDPVILSSTFPHSRILHYWSKATLFGNPLVRYVLRSSGNIPVDRKSKDRQVLFKGTFEALAKGSAVALFPEGTSYTEPKIMQVKDGAAWAALEFLKYADEIQQDEVKVIPVAIVYTNKSKYRSSVIVEFGRPISLTPYKSLFLSSPDIEGAPRMAAKQLSRDIEAQLVEHTVNAQDWDTLYAARMAREILWEGKEIELDEFVGISQTLVDLFSNPTLTPSLPLIRRRLLTYYSLLQSTNLTNSILFSLPLPSSLDPHTPTTLSFRLYSLLKFTLATLATLIQFPLLHLPFFLLPVMIHFPVYLLSRVGARLVEDEEETMAQNKVAFGLVSLVVVYVSFFFFVWKLLPFGMILGPVMAAALVWMVAVYHNRMISANYEAARRFLTAWRVLIGVWGPKKWDLSLTALGPYMTPVLPKENPWIDKPKSKSSKTKTESGEVAPSQSQVDHIPQILHDDPHLVLPREQEPPVTIPVSVLDTSSSSLSLSPLSPSPSMRTPTPSASASGTQAQTTTTAGQSQGRRPRRPPTRRIIRHVLRARMDAIDALGVLFEEIEEIDGKMRSGRWSAGVGTTTSTSTSTSMGVNVSRKGLRVRASRHLARAYGGFEDEDGDGVKALGKGKKKREQEGQEQEQHQHQEEEEEEEEDGWRYASEVIGFLRKRGAKIPKSHSYKSSTTRLRVNKPARGGERTEDEDGGWIMTGNVTSTSMSDGDATD